MRSRRSQQDPEVSLFPFLAVLLCTLGMLIMLLVLISQNSADKEGNVMAQSTPTKPAANLTKNDLIVEGPEARLPKESAENDPSDALSEETEALYEEYLQEYGGRSLEEIESGTETASWLLEELKGVQTKTAEELSSERERLASAEAQLAKLANQLIELNAQAIDASKGESEEDPENSELKAAIQEKIEAIDALSKTIEELRVKAENAGESKSYAIIPYRGKSGTFRRPIYVECSGDGIYLMPEKIPFIPEDFIVARYPGNPFDAGLRAAREYFIETGGDSARASESEPYPLLILRPDAARQYYAAKEALASWGGDYGYEFVEADAEIEYPKPDPELKRRVEDQIAAARFRLAGPLAALMNEMNAQEQYLDEGEDGDSESSDSLPSLGGGGSLASQLGPYAKIDSGSVGDSAVPFTGSRGPNLGDGQADSSLRGGDVSASAYPNASGSGSLAGNIAAGNGNLPTGQTPDGYQTAALRGGYANPSGGFSSAFASATNPNRGGSSALSGLSDDSASEEFNGETGGSMETAAISSSNSSLSANPSSAGSGNSAMGQSSRPTQTSESLSPSSTLFAQGPPKTADKSGVSVDPRLTVGNTAYLAGDEGATEAGGDVPASMAKKNPPKEKDKDKKDRKPRVESTRDAKEINLAAELKKPSQMAMERPISVECYADKIVFPKQAGLPTTRSIPYGGGNAEADQEILETIVFCVRSWKVAGRNMYWSPWIRIQVAKGGEANYERFADLMSSQNVKTVRK